MTRMLRRRAKKTGMPSESLVYTGEKKENKIAIHLIDYDESTFTEQVVSTIDVCIPYKNKPTVTWINLDGIQDVAALEKLGECFGLHKLVMEDILNTDQRPKMEDYGDYLYIVLKMLSSGQNGEIVTEQLSIILGANFVLSFQDGIEGDAFNLIRDRLRSGKGRIRKMGADYLAYALLDSVVDNYFVIIEKFGDKLEGLETELIERPSQNTVQRIYQLKRELIFLHNAVWPLREAVNALGKSDTQLISGPTTPFLRDVYDHVIHALDSIDIYREMISGMLDMYLSSVSNRLNDVIKILTVISLIFMPITFIASVYGMNFKFMPELEWKYGYPASLLVMVGIAVLMTFYFKRKKWL